MEELIMYVIVNNDLNMSGGKIAGQVGHAITNYIKEINDYKIYNIDEYDRYLRWSSDIRTKKIIVLKANQNELEKIEKMNIYYPTRDLGYTEVPCGSLTAICLGVNTKENFIKNIPKVKRFRLL